MDATSPAFRTADMWVPDLNLPVADTLPKSYVQSEAVRLEIYARVARCRSEDEPDDLEEETSRRFGKLPAAAHISLPQQSSGSTAGEEES
jgi:transcription-repair coupling factor (superfamily II helicase)